MNVIDFETLTACGECCADCKKKARNECGGCIETDGHCEEWAGSGVCPVYTCAKAHGVGFCGICAEFPCEKLPKIVHWNANIVEKQRALAEAFRKQREEL